MFEIKERTKVVVKIYGQEINLTRPTVAQMEELDVDFGGENSGKQNIVNLKKLMVALGMPEDTLQNMEMAHMVELLTFLNEELSKKK